MHFRPSLRTLVLVLLIAIGAGVVYGRLLAPGRVPYSPYSDLVPLNIAVKQVLTDGIEQGGSLPLWRDDQLGGGPAATNPEALYTYPFHFLFWLMGPLAAIGPTFFLHVVMAAFGCFFLGAALSLSFPARLFMALSGLVSFKLILVIYAGWQPYLPSLALLPWFFAATIHFGRAPGLGRGLLATFVFALCLHTAAQQFYLYAVLVMAPHVLLKSVRKRSPRPVVGLLLCGALGFALSAYLWLPVAYDLPMLTRDGGSYDFFLSGHALGLRHLWTFLYPHALGTPLDRSYPGKELWEDSAYFGIVTLGMAIFGFLTNHRDRQVRFLALGLVLTALLAFDTPLLKAAYHAIPGYRLFRCPARMLFITSYLCIALAGYGMQEMLARLSRGNALGWRPWLVYGVLVVAMTVEGAVYGSAYISTVPHNTVVPDLPIVDAIKQDPHHPRVATLGRTTYNYGWAASHGLRLVSGYDPYMFDHYRRFISLMQDGELQERPPSPWLDLGEVRRMDLLHVLNVRYLMSAAPLRDLPGWSKIAEAKDVPAFRFYRGMTKIDLWLYRREEIPGLAFFVEETLEARDRAHVERAMMGRNLVRNAVVLRPESEQALGERSSPPSPGDGVRVVFARPGSLSLRIRNAASRFLVIGEVWHPGWRATMDETPVPIYQTDLAVMGLWSPPGKHVVEMRFEPLGWRLGIGVSAVAAAVWMLLLLLYLRRRRGKLAGT